MKHASLLAFGLVLAASSAHSAVIIGNLATFNSDDGTTTGINYTPASAGPPATTAGYGNKAVGFQMGGSPYTVTSLTLRLRDVSGVTDAPVVSIWTGTSAPTSQVGTFTNPATFNGAGAFNYVFTPSSTITLNAGASYFIVVQQLTTTGPDYGFIWENGNTPGSNANSTPLGVGATYTVATFGGTASPTGTTSPSGRHNWYQLEGTLVPEPTAVSLVGIGLMTLGLRRRR